jgi:hypothetical protein
MVTLSGRQEANHFLLVGRQQPFVCTNLSDGRRDECFLKVKLVSRQTLVYGGG